MKKTKAGIVFFLSFNLLMLYMSSVSANPVLYTRMSSINENYIYSYCGIRLEGTDINATEFSFFCQLEIWNPSISTVTVNTGNFGLFNTGFKAQFDNEIFFAFSFEIESPASNQYTIPAGLSQYNYSFHFIVCPENLTALPIGNFTFWIEFDSGIDAEYLNTYLHVNSTGEFFLNEELPAYWGTTLSIVTIYISNYIISMVILIVLLLYTMKIKQLKTKR